MKSGRAAALALLLLAASPAVAEVRVPRLTGPVVDVAGVLESRWEKRLGDLSRAARARNGGTGPQLQFLVVSSLEGEPVESFALRVAEDWKIGTKGRDDGVLIVVAVKDRKVRIEVGGGIEGALTDAQAGRIIRGVIAPAFREGRYGEGLYAAGQQVLAALGALPPEMSQAQRGPGPSRPVPVPIVGGLLGFLLGLGAPLFVLLIVLLVLARVVAAGRRMGPRGPPGGGGFGGWGGGGFGGGGGGGGWSGGGGGFSGGGASGSW